MKRVRDYLDEWVGYMGAEITKLGVDDLLDAEVHSAAFAVDLVNSRISNLRMWMEGCQPRLPLDNRMRLPLPTTPANEQLDILIRNLNSGRWTPSVGIDRCRRLEGPGLRVQVGKRLDGKKVTVAQVLVETINLATERGFHTSDVTEQTGDGFVIHFVPAMPMA